MNIGRIRPGTIARRRSPRHSISRAPLVLSVVDTRTGMLHRVAVETAALHRNSGCYPALCGVELPAASLTTQAAGCCRECGVLTQRAVAAPDREPRRPFLQRIRRPGPIR